MGARSVLPRRSPRSSISIHAPRMGARQEQVILAHRRRHFNPRAPHGGATLLCVFQLGEPLFQSTRPAWGREERQIVGDAADVFQSTRPAWGRGGGIMAKSISELFQSTRPAWGRDQVVLRALTSKRFQSTRPAWGRDGTIAAGTPILAISIHAPRMGARFAGRRIVDVLHIFQSTRPAWGRDGSLQ